MSKPPWSLPRTLRPAASGLVLAVLASAACSTTSEPGFGIDVLAATEPTKAGQGGIAGRPSTVADRPDGAAGTDAPQGGAAGATGEPDPCHLKQCGTVDGVVCGACAAGEVCLPGDRCGVPPSCTETTPCGDGVSCCDAVLVPSGILMQGSSEDVTDTDGYPGPLAAGERPERRVTLRAFYLDRYEVTVGRFREFWRQYRHSSSTPDAGAGAHPADPTSGWDPVWDGELPKAGGLFETDKQAFAAALRCGGQANFTELPGDTDQSPINCVSWYEAFAFCVWDGGRLPSEAEWEYAAAGGDRDRRFPWGNALPLEEGESDLVNYGLTWGSPSNPVGLLSLGVGPFGHADLAGNVWEWTLDAYSEDWLQQDSECADCVNAGFEDPLGAPVDRVRKGGGWNDLQPDTLRAAHRGHLPPSYRTEPIGDVQYANTGFRCARDPR